MSQPAKKQSKQFDEYECGNGPRPPVPGEESQISKMTTEGACCSTLNSNRSPDIDDTFTNRVEKWLQKLEFLLADQEGRLLIYNFVKEECDNNPNDSNCARLNFYYACDGLKVETAKIFNNDYTDNEKENARKKARKFTRVIR